MGINMKNLIINAFAFKEDYQTSLQIGGKADNTLINLYMKNIFVSLKSAKLKNPQDEVMLLTNRPVPGEFAALFDENDIRVQVIAFDDFLLPARFVWSLAFFKLCALSYAVRCLDYERVLLLDADTVTVHSYEELWREADYGVMLFPVGHSFCHRDREIIRKDFQGLYPEKDLNIVHYGGEFVCGRREHLRKFVKECENVYNTLKEQGFSVAGNAGDETVLSIAAAFMGGVTDAQAYIYRYWTNEFYLVSTNTVNNPVAVWHVPDEKKQGFLYLYEFYRKKGVFPDAKRLAEIFGIVKARRPFNYFTLRRKVLGKCGKVWEKYRKL